MSSTSASAGSVFPVVRKNPLGRVALALAIVQVLIVVAWTILQPALIAQATTAPALTGDANMPTGLAAYGVITTAVNLISLLLALVAMTLGIVACRRTGQPKVAAAIAVGVGGSAVASYAALLIGSTLMTAAVTR